MIQNMNQEFGRLCSSKIVHINIFYLNMKPIGLEIIGKGYINLIHSFLYIFAYQFKN